MEMVKYIEHKGELSLKVDGLSPVEMRTVRECVVRLLEERAFDIGPGSITFFFDENRILQQVEVRKIPWKRRKGLFNP